MEPTTKTRARNVSLSNKNPPSLLEDDSQFIHIPSEDFFNESVMGKGSSNSAADWLDSSQNDDPAYKEYLLRKHRGRRTLYLVYCVILTLAQMALAFWSIYILVVDLIVQRHIWNKFSIFIDALCAIPVQWIVILIAVSEITGRMFWALPHLLRRHTCPGSVWLLSLSIFVGICWNCMLRFSLMREDSCHLENDVMWLMWCYRIYISRGMSYFFCALILCLLGCCLCSVLIWMLVIVVTVFMRTCVSRRNDRKYDLLATSIADD
uniref:Uncharacterized protein n=1 Tax=Percolomonas cosmopolitus TaxID=63605 RepID=A0A7S1PKT2_9EUKA|mmetsp:Transcript_9819/g.36630  ORF Transcript_9819/g.36630 Transcript_9819/m.36630 type:complete len:264 (+) Transcript_9819:150-941(+)|eukprot:CAMPEP_0117452936 /NCGR_PEP_ID=MMETSP0759-20121206/9916_1 /TAXON_ID=63605 /ORGANISM="Percolomonas cosmopolitus, Strain WS" /LENGTH=263 /DNA_ID=CAMNT_0005245855 /DNA_START=139 /DNA_END=930 /DNA_ORIENTATION=+